MAVSSVERCAYAENKQEWIMNNDETVTPERRSVILLGSKNPSQMFLSVSAAVFVFKCIYLYELRMNLRENGPTDVIWQPVINTAGKYPRTAKSGQ